MKGEFWYFSNARLLDGSEEKVPHEPYAIVVSGRYIKAVAPQFQLSCQEGAKQIDLLGMMLMPAMIDCHDHLANLEDNIVSRMAVPPALAAFKTAHGPFQKTLLGGFTSIQDAAGVDLGMKLAVEQGLIPGPQLKISVDILSQYGGHNDHTEKGLAILKETKKKGENIGCMVFVSSRPPSRQRIPEKVRKLFSRGQVSAGSSRKLHRDETTSVKEERKDYAVKFLCGLAANRK